MSDFAPGGRKGEGMSPKEFKDYLLKKLQDNPKTSWGKNELRLYITEVYAEFLEREVKQ